MPELCFVRAAYLKSAAGQCPDHCAFQEFGLWLGAMAVAQGKLAAYSPLIEGQAGDAWRGGFDTVTTQTTWEAFLRNHVSPKRPPRRGAAGYSAERSL